MDSGNDAEENFAHLKDHAFIIKRNMRREKPEQWLALARRVGVSALKPDTREGKNVYTGFTNHFCPGGIKSTTGPVSIAFEVIKRLYDPEGNRLLIAEIGVNTFWPGQKRTYQRPTWMAHRILTLTPTQEQLEASIRSKNCPALGNWA